jgi:2-hydroxycyclohexanecarboxyl-CoA dehydrogenase
MSQQQDQINGAGAVVVGGASGLGVAVARALRASGSDIVLIDDHLPIIDGEPFQFVKADVRDPDQVAAAFAEVKAHLPTLGSAVVVPKPVSAACAAEHLEPDVWEDVLDRQLNGVFWVAQQAARLMLQTGGGSMVFVSSLAGTLVDKFDLRAHHHAANAAINTLAKGLAVEWGDRGLRVNTVAPGAVDGDSGCGTALDDINRITAMTPLRRLSTVSEIVSVILFLCSSASSFISGQTLVADGGRGLLFD